ncbi:MAG: cbb3-type cytochrome oxidase assembly protein [Pyrinomonadaceae bacterium]
MTLTWIAIIASLLMGAGAACIFIWAAKKNYFSDLEDAKYQVFWSDVEELINEAEEDDENERKERRSS